MAKRKAESLRADSGSSSEDSTGSSSASSEYSSSTGSCNASSESAELQAKVTDLSLNQVLFGDEDSSSDDCYQANGKSKDRIRKALQSPCCARKCKRNLAFKTVLRVVTCFWSLTKAGQDALLWSLQHPVWTVQSDNDSDSSSGESDAKVVAWHIAGILTLSQQ